MNILPEVLVRIRGESWFIPSGWLNERLKFVREFLPFALLHTDKDWQEKKNEKFFLVFFFFQIKLIIILNY